jgi:hypothetical protein
MRNTADVTGGKPIAVFLQPISGVSAINSLIAFYDIHGGKRGALLLFFPKHHTRHYIITIVGPLQTCQLGHKSFLSGLSLTLIGISDLSLALLVLCVPTKKGFVAFNRLLRHPWRKERGATLLFCPGHHTTHTAHHTRQRKPHSALIVCF